MQRSLVLRALIVLALVAASAAAALLVPPRLGLDLRGGTQIVIEARDGPVTKATAESTDRALEVLRRRVDALGVAEATLARSGERRIVVELPDVRDPREAAEVVGRTAQLTVHAVLGVATDTAPSPSPSTSPSPSPSAGAGAQGELVLPDEQGGRLRLGPTVLTGEAISDAVATTDEYGVQWMVDLSFTGPGGRSWQQVTGQAACAPPGDPTRRVAIVLDDRIISSPQVNESVACQAGIAGGRTSITGTFTQESAKDLAALVKGGALPVPVEVVEQRVVGPTLGAEAIEATWKAALIGVAATLVFLVLVYRFVGLLSAVGLVIYALLAYAALVRMGATFTLPGLAGFVLAVGMAVDANVLAFERAREELPAQPAGPRRLLRAGVAGFRRALTAVADSNVTTLLAAGLLFFLASGPVRGFGVTLSIGVLASMVSALVVVRLFVELALRARWLTRRPRLSGIAGQGAVRTWLTRRDPQLMRRPRRWIALSVLVVAVSATGIGVRGLDLGVEFTGGRLIEYSASAPLDVDRARQAVSDAGFPRAVVNAAEDGGVVVRTQQLDNAEQARVTAALSGLAPGVEVERDELIGPSLGSELRMKALIALGVALLAQLAYLSVRFRWTYGLSAALGMAHDVVVLIGVFAWLGKPVDGVFLAALLTVIGYSVNDTVVLFDRVRERRRDHPREPWPVAVNSSVVSTAPRTVNTGLGALFVLVALAVLGGDSLQDFALALIVGIVVGTWSSSFTAAPLLIELQDRTGGADRAVRAAAGRGPARGGRAGSGTGGGAGRDADARPGRGASGAFDPADPYGRPDDAADESGARL